MNRKYIIDLVNNEILPQINNYWTWRDITPPKELIKLVIDFRSTQVKAGTARNDDKLTAKVTNGFLYINDKPIKRIAPLDPKPAFNEYSHYIEGKILARQEALYNN